MRPYRRKLSREDSDTGSILITKNRWPDFPAPMTAFEVRVGRSRYSTRIVAEDCECVAPKHQHYHLEAGHFARRLKFKPGDLVQIVREGSVYVLRNG
ncbi:MAG: hypothetical protein HY873_03095 [Chloroflexi bacterium]|nr:hypothetical protein [Chloroflexota bacterium]